MKKLLHFAARQLLLVLACCFSLSAFAQKVSVQGTVVDENGSPLIGASVVVMSGEKILGGELQLTFRVHLLFLLSLVTLSRSHLWDTRTRELQLRLRSLPTKFSLRLIVRRWRR